MKSIWLAVTVFGVVLAKPENFGGFGYELIMNVLENVHNNTRSSEHDLRSIASKIGQLMDDQQKVSKSFHQDLRSILTKQDQLMDLIVAAEPSRCPENAADGVYKLKPGYSSIPAFSVYCENGWIVIHRRFNGSLDFNRNWVPYREGFGDLQGEHWLGLEKMHQISRVGSYELKVVLKNFDGVVKTAEYEGFKIGSEIDQYRLDLARFSKGNAGDSLFIGHNTMKFSAPDRRNDKNSPGPSCAVYFSSGWWFTNCFNSNLNGLYNKEGKGKTMTWSAFNENLECLKEARMMIRAVKPKI